jgi:hypothetical protein
MRWGADECVGGGAGEGAGGGVCGVTRGCPGGGVPPSGMQGGGFIVLTATAAATATATALTAAATTAATAVAAAVNVVMRVLRVVKDVSRGIDMYL